MKFMQSFITSNSGDKYYFNIPTTRQGSVIRQIGIEYPHGVPVTEIVDWATIKTYIYLNNNKYYITDREVLEFEDLNIKINDFMKPYIETNNPYVIISIGYE